jgi:O-antigen ligase
VFAFALLLFSWAEAKRTGLKLVLAASLALTVAALLLTFSRSAFVGLIVVSALYMLWRRNAGTLTVLGLLAVAALFVIPSVFSDRMTAGFGGGFNAVSAGRIEGLWLPLLPEALHSPVYGHGLGSILWSEAMRHGAGGTVLAVTHPHNAYLEALLDMGLVGLLLVCAYFAHVWVSLRKLSIDRSVSPVLRGFFEGASAGLLTLLIMSTVDSSLVPKPEYALLWLAIGVMYGQLARKAAPR